MKYIVAIKYRDSKDLLFKSELFEFNNKESRNDFVNDVRSLAEEIAFSQYKEKE